MIIFTDFRTTTPSKLAVKTQTWPIMSLSDLAVYDFKLGILKNSTIQQMFEKAKVGSEFHNIWKNNINLSSIKLWK